MFFKRKKLQELEPNQPLYTIIQIEDRPENCGASVEVEVYYRIRNNMSGKKSWINKRFARNYGLL